MIKGETRPSQGLGGVGPLPAGHTTPRIDPWLHPWILRCAHSGDDFPETALIVLLSVRQKKLRFTSALLMGEEETASAQRFPGNERRCFIRDVVTLISGEIRAASPGVIAPLLSGDGSEGGWAGFTPDASRKGGCVRVVGWGSRWNCFESQLR